MSESPLSNSLQDNINLFVEMFGINSDLTVRTIAFSDVPSAAVLFIESLVDKAIIDEFVIKDLNSQLVHAASIHDIRLSTNSVASIQSVEEVANRLLTGHSIILFEQESTAIAAGTEGGLRRPVSEPTSESIVRGPQDAFNESLQTNIGLLRRRIASPKLRIEKIQIGEVTHTPVAIAYLDGIAQEGIVKEVKTRLDKICIDGILGALYIEEWIEDPRGYTPFPTIYNTERPDRIAGGLLEGRIAIMVEGTPISMLVPSTMNNFLISNEDYYQRYDIASLMRILRVAAFVFSFLLPGFYVTLLTYHQEMLPTPLLIALTGQREGVPFGISIELTAMELTFELLREAGVRLPKTIGSAVSIVGGLVLGTAAVEAGLVAPGTVISVSITAIASFCIPSYNLVITSRILRFFLLFLASVFGAYGLFFGLILICIHLNTLRSFGVPYLASLAPFHLQNWKDLFIRFPMWAHQYRPEEIAGDNARKVRTKPKWHN